MTGQEKRRVHAALRRQLAAVKQHFIHVLILKARGDSESAAEITKIDSIDLPSAMQLVERLVRTEFPIDLCNAHSDVLETLPAPGFSDREIAASEDRLESDMAAAFEDALRAPAVASDRPTHRILTVSHGSRQPYRAWLSGWGQGPDDGQREMPNLTEAQTRAIDTLFANLMVVIDQAMIHALVQFIAGRNAMADLTWEASGGAMMQATKITNALARYGLCANPVAASRADPHCVRHHEIRSDPEMAFRADRDLAAYCSKIAHGFRAELTETEFEDLSQQTAHYFDAVANWAEGRSLPNIPNPCRDFERTRRLYLGPDAIGRTG